MLALLFLGAGLYTYEARSKYRQWGVPRLLLMAYFSKSMSIIAVGLLLAQDLAAERKPRWRMLLACLVVALFAFFIHLQVGGQVSMVGGPLSSSKQTALFTMGEVLLRYGQILVYPPSLSVVHDVTPRDSLTFAGIMGYTALLGWLAGP